MGCTLQQTAVEVENVTRVCFTTRRTLQKQRDLTVSNSLLRQVIIYDQCIFTAVTEVLTHGTTRIRCQVLQSSRFRSRSRNNDGVSQRAVFFQFAYYVSNSRSLLANCYVNTLNAWH